MIATVDEAGTLTVRPETPIEAYALKQWWNSYDRGQKMIMPGSEIKLGPQPTPSTFRIITSLESDQ